MLQRDRFFQLRKNPIYIIDLTEDSSVICQRHRLSVTEAQLWATDKQRQGRTSNPFFSSERNNSPTYPQAQAKKDNTNTGYKPKLSISVLSCCSFWEMRWAVTDFLHHPLDPQTHHYHGAVLCWYHPCHFTANSSWVLRPAKFLFCFQTYLKTKICFCTVTQTIW